MRPDEVPVLIHSTTVKGVEEQELLELQEQLKPRELEEDPDILRAWEQVTLGEEMGMEDAVLEDVDGGRRHPEDYVESEGSREDREGMEDSVRGRGSSLSGPVRGCR